MFLKWHSQVTHYIGGSFTKSFHDSPFLLLKKVLCGAHGREKWEGILASNILQSQRLDQKEQTLHTTMMESASVWNGINDINYKFDFSLFLNFLDMASLPLYFWLVSLHVLTFFWVVLLRHTIFSLYLTVDHASLACHLFSLPHCGSCFFGMPSFLFLA